MSFHFLEAGGLSRTSLQTLHYLQLTPTVRPPKLLYICAALAGNGGILRVLWEDAHQKFLPESPINLMRGAANGWRHNEWADTRALLYRHKIVVEKWADPRALLYDHKIVFEKWADSRALLYGHKIVF